MITDAAVKIWDQISRVPGLNRLARLTRYLQPLDRFFDDDVQVGLDIGTFAVKAVAVSHTVVGPRVLQCAYQPIFPDQAAGRLPGTQDIIDAVKRTMDALNIRQRRVCLGISDADVFIRHIRVPPASDAELAKTVRWEAEKYCPIPQDESIVDYIPIEREKSDSPDQMQEVVLVVVSRKTIDRYLEICRAAGLTPLSMEPSSLAAARGIMQSRPDSTGITPVLMMGEAVSTILLVRKGDVFLVRNISINSREIREALAHPESFSLMTDQYQPPPAAEGKSSESGIHELIRQFNRSLAYSEREFLNEAVSEVLLCGGNAGIAGLDGFLARILSRPVKVYDAAKVCQEFGASGPFAGAEAPSMVGALGAAWGGV